MYSRIRRLWSSDSGQSTVETAFGIAALVVVLMIAVSALVSVAMYLSATDAAGSIARAAARGDADKAKAIQQAVSAEVSIADRGTTVEVVVRRDGGFIPIRASAVALKEPTDNEPTDDDNSTAN